MKIILSARPTVFPVTSQKLALIIGAIITWSLIEFGLVRFSSPENLIFFTACAHPYESGQLKEDQVFSKGYSPTDLTFLAVQLINYIFHTIGLVTTFGTALWLRKQEKILASDKSNVSKTSHYYYSRLIFH